MLSFTSCPGSAMWRQAHQPAEPAPPEDGPEAKFSVTCRMITVICPANYALQLSGSGVVNAPAWAGFTTWELVRGSNVVRNLHLEAHLSAALANGDDTLSITADCYSVAAAALAAALLAYYLICPANYGDLSSKFRASRAGTAIDRRHRSNHCSHGTSKNPGAGLVWAWRGPGAVRAWCGLQDRSRGAGLAPRPKPRSRPCSKSEAAEPASLSGHPRTVSVTRT